MFCKKCGTKLNDDALFCAKCGVRTDVVAHAGDSKQNFDVAANAVVAANSSASVASDSCVSPKRSVSKSLIISLALGGLLLLLFIAGALLVPNMISSKAQSQVTACKSNLKNIGTALEMYATDNAGRYPPSLDYLTISGEGGAYLRCIPVCPACEKDTYSSSYLHGNNPDCYFVYCSGHNHKAVNLEANAPAFDSATGLQETGIDGLIQAFKRASEAKDEASFEDSDGTAEIALSPDTSHDTDSQPEIDKPDMPGPAPSELFIGNSVFFGEYPQNGSNPEPIEWLVLEADDNQALLISRYALDCKTFHRSALSSWRDSDLRVWLNDKFLNKAFNHDERSRIAKVTINTRANGKYGTAGCGDTQDKIFCLSLDEANNLFSGDAERKCWPTTYAVSRNAYRYDDTGGSCCFWLRSPGKNNGRAAYVRNDGVADYYGDDAWDDIFAVRPALRIKVNP